METQHVLEVSESSQCWSWSWKPSTHWMCPSLHSVEVDHGNNQSNPAFIERVRVFTVLKLDTIRRKKKNFTGFSLLFTDWHEEVQVCVTGVHHGNKRVLQVVSYWHTFYSPCGILRFLHLSRSFKTFWTRISMLVPSILIRNAPLVTLIINIHCSLHLILGSMLCCLKQQSLIACVESAHGVGEKHSADAASLRKTKTVTWISKA